MTCKRAFLAILVLLPIAMTAAYFLTDMESETLDEATRARLGIAYTELSHGATYYELLGPENAETVVLVHGFSIPSYLWDRNIQSLVDAGFRVLRFDLYGRGYSARPELDYSLELFVDQLDELTRNLEIQTPFHLVGISMGAAISARYAVQSPQRVRSLSLLAPLVATPERSELKLLALPGIGEYLATVVMMPKIKGNLSQAVYDTKSYPEWDEKIAQHIHFKGYRRALLNTLRHLAGETEIETYKLLGQTDVPVQLIWGREDQIADYAQAEALQALMPDMELHTLEQSGHLPQIEHAERVNQWLVAHAARHRKRTAKELDASSLK